MELTYTRNHKSALPATLQSIGLAFVKKYSSVFKVLCSAGVSYGGNWLAPDALSTQKNMLSQLNQLQEQLDELSQNVTLLNQQLSIQNPLAIEKEGLDSPEIGIHRFRLLQTEK